MNRERKLQLFVAALVAASFATVVLSAMFAVAFSTPAHAQEQQTCDPTMVCYEYARYTGDSRAARYHAIFVISTTFDAWRFTRAATEAGGFAGSDVYGDMVVGRADQLLTDCADGSVTHADVAKAFFGWALERQIPATTGTGFAVTMFAEEVCGKAVGEST